MPTYGATRTKFLSRLKRRDCTNELADGFLQDAFARIQRVMRVPAGEKSVSIEIGNATFFDNGYLLIPSDYIQLKDISYNGKTVLKRRDLATVLNEANHGAQGCTRFYCRQGATWLLGPLPVAGDKVRIDYYSEFENASVDVDETILLDIAQDLLVYGALSYACDHWSDSRGDKFEQRFTQILSDLTDQADRDELTGDACVAPAFHYPSDF